MFFYTPYICAHPIYIVIPNQSIGTTYEYLLCRYQLCLFHNHPFTMYQSSSGENVIRKCLITATGSRWYIYNWKNLLARTLLH